jgi:integrase
MGPNSQQTKPKTHRAYTFCLQNLHVFFGKAYLSEITKKGVEQYVTRRKERGKKPATINRDLAVLKALFNKAIEWGHASRNPVKGIRMLKENNKRTRYLELPEIQALLQRCDGPLRDIVTVALNSGMRREEILNLKWGEINLATREITIRESKGNRLRYVPINDTLAECFGNRPKQVGNPHLFRDERGSPEKNLRKRWEAAVREAGIQDFRFHDLRHTFSSYLVMRGADLKTVQEILGHRTLEMTMRYAHLAESHKLEAVRRLNLGTGPEKAPIPIRNANYLQTAVG